MKAHFGKIAFLLATEARICYNNGAESFSRADVVLRVSSGRAAWLANGAEERGAIASQWLLMRKN